MNHYTEDSVISDMVLHSPDSTSSSEDEDNHAATSPGEQRFSPYDGWSRCNSLQQLISI
jgi:hypothetical protein